MDYKGNIVWKYDLKPANAYQVEHDELHNFIRKNIPHNDAYYGATSSFTAALGRYAAYTGKELKWDATLALNDSVMPESMDPSAPAPVKANADGSFTLPNSRDYKLVGS
jgi:hypothetical protein